MQRVTILCVGKLKERFYTDAAAEYLKRLSRCCKAEVIELPEERLPEDPSSAQIEAPKPIKAAASRYFFFIFTTILRSVQIYKKYVRKTTIGKVYWTRRHSLPIFFHNIAPVFAKLM